jgi:hypothetical protein
MPCYQTTNLPGGVTTTGRTSYTTEADCLNSCTEGACCEGTVCTVKPQCQCQGAGKVFKGVGTTCTPNPCSLCDLSSISLSTSGTASGFWAASFISYICPDQQYSVGASGAGTLTKDDGQLLGRAFCSHNSGVGRCAYRGQFAIGNGATLGVVLVFFTVGSDIRYAIYSNVFSGTSAAITACGPPPLGQSYNGATAAYEGCSSVIGSVSESGALSVNLNNAPPLEITGLGDAAGYGFAARGGSVTFSFNPLP